MTEPPNPYGRPTRALVEADCTPMRMPPTMIAALAIYVVIYPIEVIPLIDTPVWKLKFFVPTMASLGVYTLVMTFALWRRWQWARLWLVLTTAVTAFLLARMVWRGVSMEHGYAYLAAVLRIAVTVLVLLPASRRWFAAKAG